MQGPLGLDAVGRRVSAATSANVVACGLGGITLDLFFAIRSSQQLAPLIVETSEYFYSTLPLRVNTFENKISETTVFLQHVPRVLFRHMCQGRFKRLHISISEALLAEALLAIWVALLAGGLSLTPLT